jgi:hypothetical protein
LINFSLKRKALLKLAKEVSFKINLFDKEEYRLDKELGFLELKTALVGPKKLLNQAFKFFKNIQKLDIYGK